MPPRRSTRRKKPTAAQAQSATSTRRRPRKKVPIDENAPPDLPPPDVVAKSSHPNPLNEKRTTVSEDEVAQAQGTGSPRGHTVLTPAHGADDEWPSSDAHPPARLRPSLRENAEEAIPNTPPSLAVTERANQPAGISDEDEITPVYKSPARLLPTQKDPLEAPGSPQPDPGPDRPVLQPLQPRMAHPFRPVSHTYGKRRRMRPCAVPSMRQLGVLRPASPSGSSPSRSANGSPAKDGDEGGDVNEGGSSSDEEEGTQQVRDRGLEKFMKEQQKFWAEVDDVDLEEAFD